MAVHVRDLLAHEGQRLLQISRKSKSPIEVRRAQVLIASDQGMGASEIAALYHLSPDYVRKIIHRFNEEGLDSIKEAYTNGGRPSRFTPEEKSVVLEVATMPPMILGLPFTHWSLRKLRDYLMKSGTVKKIHHEQVRQILKGAKWSLQRTKTWKQSNDPKFASKKNASRRSTKPRQKKGGSSV